MTRGIGILALLGLLGCAAREARPEAPVVVYEASPYPRQAEAVAPAEDAVVALEAALDALERAPADLGHAPEQAVLARLAEAVEATAPDAAGRSAAAEIRRLAARLEDSHHASDRHADWVEAAFLAALGPARAAVTDRWDLPEALARAEGAVTAIREDRPLLTQRRAVVAAGRGVAEVLGRMGRVAAPARM